VVPQLAVVVEVVTAHLVVVELALMEQPTRVVVVVVVLLILLVQQVVQV
jgi:hypothetical protein